jgi:hypothetical protein
MRFMLLLRSNAQAESGITPSTELISAMMSFYSAMNSAGVVLGADGLHASSKDSARVAFSPPSAGAEEVKTEVTAGPFTPASELVAGYWIIQVKDLEEALGWAKKCPLKDDAVIEVRRIVEMSDFEENVTEELKESSERMRTETEERVKGLGK